MSPLFAIALLNASLFQTILAKITPFAQPSTQKKHQSPKYISSLIQRIPLKKVTTSLYILPTPPSAAHRILANLRYIFPIHRAFPYIE